MAFISLPHLAKTKNKEAVLVVWNMAWVFAGDGNMLKLNIMWNFEATHFFIAPVSPVVQVNDSGVVKTDSGIKRQAAGILSTCINRRQQGV